MDVNYGEGPSIFAGINDNNNTNSQQLGEDDEDLMDLRRGPWTVEEDHTLISYIAKHGEGRWNSLARCAGLKRTGKSCRLRWLNYLRPDVRRGNITLEEQLLILELHSRWGNRWSKIAQYLPGRTDNEIKNYWRTRVQKHAKQLKCDVNSKQFKDTMRYLWMPRLVERIQAAAAAEATMDTSGVPGSATTSTHNYYNLNDNYNNNNNDDMFVGNNNNNQMTVLPSHASENSSTTAASSDSFGAQVSPTVSDITDNYHVPGCYNPNPDCYFPGGNGPVAYMDSFISPLGFYNPAGFDYQNMELNNNSSNGDDNQWMEGGLIPDNMWNLEDIWLQQFSNNF